MFWVRCVSNLLQQQNCRRSPVSHGCNELVEDASENSDTLFNKCYMHLLNIYKVFFKVWCYKYCFRVEDQGPVIANCSTT